MKHLTSFLVGVIAIWYLTPSTDVYKRQVLGFIETQALSEVQTTSFPSALAVVAVNVPEAPALRFNGSSLIETLGTVGSWGS